MIVGRFGDTAGRPYVEAIVIVLFSRLNIKLNVSFLVDTGADISVINPVDGIQAKLPYNNLTNADDVSGIGGTRKDLFGTGGHRICRLPSHFARADAMFSGNARAVDAHQA